MNDAMVTTALEIPGYTITRNHGVVRGINVRSRATLIKPPQNGKS